MVGTRLGHYLVEAQLGAGGMGVVYRALDTRLHRPVAIKVFADMSANARARERLLHEARTASALNHPNVCTIYDVGEAGATTYLVMEYVEGQPLSALIPQNGFPLHTVLDYGIQIASALGHAHARGVVHRDLKCANIVVTPDGRPKVLDFGVALRTGDALDETAIATQTSDDSLYDGGRVVGSVSYMAPEALRGGLVDARADIWALGVVLYEMAAGHLPFRGLTPFEVSARIMNDPPAPTPATVPPALRAVIVRCLQKDPAQRYDDALGVRGALEALQSTGMRAAIPRTPARSSVLVLPFANLSTNPESDYFSDGLAEEIIADLSNVHQLRVISGTSSLRLKGSDRPLTELAADLHVDYVVEGSVRRNGPQLRVTAKLVDAASDASVWGQKYTGTIEDVFTIQETMARSIVEALRLTLTDEEEERLAEHPIGDVRAYEWYLRARQEMLRFTEDGLRRALEYLERSEAITGQNVLLLGARGYAYWQFVNAGVSSDTTYLDKAEECARAILRLAPGSPHGNRLLGLVSVHRGNMTEALRRLKLALDTEPNDPDSLMWGSLLASLSGKMELAERWAARLVEIDPLTPVYQVVPATVASMHGDFERAVQAFAPHYTALMDAPVLRLIYGQILALAGRTEEARRVLGDLARSLPDDVFAQLAGAYVHALLGHRQQVVDSITPAMTEALGRDPQYCWLLAQCYALVDEVDAGVHWMEQAVAHGFVNYPLLAQLDPFLDALRGDQRYHALMDDVQERWRTLDETR